MHVYDSVEVRNWPEFKALAKRLGIPVDDEHVTQIVITLPSRGPVRYTVERHATGDKARPTPPSNVETRDGVPRPSGPGPTPPAR